MATMPGGEPLREQADGELPEARVGMRLRGDGADVGPDVRAPRPDGDRMGRDADPEASGARAAGNHAERGKERSQLGGALGCSAIVRHVVSPQRAC